jgi:hypothetical protein
VGRPAKLRVNFQCDFESELPPRGLKCASFFARLEARAERLARRNTIHKRFGNGRKSRERVGLRSTRRRASEGAGRVKTARSIREDTGFGCLVDPVFRPVRQKRREKVGSKSVAIKLYGKRKQQVLEGKKLPELFRKPSINFGQLSDDALAYSKRNKRSYKTDVPRFANLKDWFGKHVAEELTPKEIENKLASVAEKGKWAPSTFNHYRSLMSLSYRL